MEGYVKQDAVLVASAAKICADNTLVMRVKPNSKAPKLVEFANNKLIAGTPVLWRGVGDACTKTIACAEVMKREYGRRTPAVKPSTENPVMETTPNTSTAEDTRSAVLEPLHQVTTLSYEAWDDMWTPLEEGSELETIRVRRQVPVVEVLLTIGECDVTQNGYQLAFDPLSSASLKSPKAPNPRKNYKPNPYSATNQYMKPVRSKKGKAAPMKGGEKYEELFGDGQKKE